MLVSCRESQKKPAKNYNWKIKGHRNPHCWEPCLIWDSKTQTRSNAKTQSLSKKGDREVGLLLRALVPMTVTTCDICFGRKKRRKREEELGLLYPRVEWHFPVCAPWDPNSLKYLGSGKVGFREVETLQKPTPKKKKNQQQQFSGQIHLKRTSYSFPLIERQKTLSGHSRSWRGPEIWKLFHSFEPKTPHHNIWPQSLCPPNTDQVPQICPWENPVSLTN